ncbi:MAG: ParB/RepB/Spo0J family partition protein, partial [Clostridia bacterium]|nr:ParB/RepB/Spo0J family partition protein [Clostridia bacterium]
TVALVLAGTRTWVSQPISRLREGITHMAQGDLDTRIAFKGHDELSELAQSIRANGIIQPIVVRRVGDKFQLVAGERRWRASKLAGLTHVPVVIQDIPDDRLLEITLIENIQREDLNPVEEAEGYRMLLESYSMTQEEIAERVGRSRPAVANALRLLGLPKDVLEMVRSGSLSQGHARTLLGIENGDQLKKTAEEVSEKGLSVREVEKLVRQAAQPEKVKPPSPQKTMLEGEIERGLSEQLGRKVKITRGKNRGVLEIEFYNEEDLKQLSMLLSGD